MDWYYVEGEQRVGPVAEEQFELLVAQGTVTDSTLVWRNGMDGWIPYADARAGVEQAQSIPAGHVTCIECAGTFPRDEVIEYQGSFVCGACKPVFFQRVKEGGALPSDFVYGGFWIRFVAKFLDNILATAVTWAVTIPLGWLASSAGENAQVAVVFIVVVISYAIPVAYVTFFIGRYGATLGKMAVGLKVVRPDGGRVTYLRAFGRYFAEILSAMIFLIGYIMAAFDEEKRSLHDRICDTRVIRTR